MNLRTKIGLALRVTLLLVLWATICLLSNDTRSYILEAMAEGIECVDFTSESPTFVKK